MDRHYFGRDFSRNLFALSFCTVFVCIGSSGMRRVVRTCIYTAASVLVGRTVSCGRRSVSGVRSRTDFEKLQRLQRMARRFRPSVSVSAPALCLRVRNFGRIFQLPHDRKTQRAAKKPKELKKTGCIFCCEVCGLVIRKNFLCRKDISVLAGICKLRERKKQE